MKRFSLGNSTVRLVTLSFALLAAGLFAGQKAANATTITEVADNSGANTTITYSGSGTPTLSGGDTGTSALAYSTDWIEFMITPSTGAVASVVVNSVTPYPNSYFEIGTTATNGSLLGPTVSDNTAYAVTLTSGVDYYMSFSSGTPEGTGSQSFGIADPPSVPEIDPQNATSALALLIGAVLVIRGRRKKMILSENAWELA